MFPFHRAGLAGTFQLLAEGCVCQSPAPAVPYPVAHTTQATTWNSALANRELSLLCNHLFPSCIFSLNQCVFMEILGVSLDQQLLYCLLGSPLCGLRFLCLFLSLGFHFWNGVSTRRYAMGTRVKQCLIEQDRMFLLSVSSPYLTSGLSLHFGSRFHGL